MRKYQLPLLLSIVLVTLICQNQLFAQADSGTFLLHKFEQNIGKENYLLTKSGSIWKYDVKFKFVDRGSPVPLNAQLNTTSSYEPISLFIKGSTSRFSTINDSIYIKNNSAQIRVDDSLYTKSIEANSFPVGGYSPGTVQMLLIQYWKRHNRPAYVHMLPTGTVRITMDGKDTISFMNDHLVLERYVLNGLVWGNELLWTDEKGRLICLITNDAEGDKLEMMLEPYETLLPELISRAATYGMHLFSASTSVLASDRNRALAIVGGNVIDVISNQTIENAVILVENGRIKKVGKLNSISIPKTAKIIHAEGKTILPGLWDMHAHFEQAEWGPAYLAAGVTTVRDCGNEFGYINAIQHSIDAGNGIGPHILKAGIIDGPGAMGLGIIRATTKEEAIAAVQRYKQNGFVQIKIYSSVKPAIVKAICDEAHHLGLTVTGHIPNGMTLLQGVDSGMDQVNHIQYLYSAMKRNKDRSIDLMDSSNVSVLNFIKNHNTVIDPTIGVFEMIFRSVKDDITIMEPAFYSLPLPLQILFKNTGMPATQALLFKPMMKSMGNIIKAMHDMGITIVAGTDMGFPGYSLDRELELYVEAGLTPFEAIQTATITPSKVMNQDKKTGSIEEGKQADLIIVDGNPLKQIRDIRNVWMVIKDGTSYDPKKLHQLVGFKP